VSSQAQAISTAGITALFFGFHPLHVESVVWVSERKDLLCAFFVLLSIRAYIAYAVAPASRKRLLRFAACVVFAALAFMAKPMAVSLPLILLLIDVYPLRRFSGGAERMSSVLLEKIPFVVMSAASCLVTLLAQQSVKAIGSFDVLPLHARLLNGMHALAFYLQKMFVPGGLSPLYSYPPPSQMRLSDFRYLMSIMAVGLITAGCVWLSKRGKHLCSAVWAYYVLTLLPVLGIIQVGMQAAADRYTYLPGISIFLLAGLVISRVWDDVLLKRNQPLKKGFVLLAMFCILFALGMLTVRQIGVWRTSESLWEFVVAHATIKNPVAYNNLGIIRAHAGRLEEAMYAYKQALAVRPDYANARNNLGNVYSRIGDVDAAIFEYKRLLTRNPDHAGAHYNLGRSYHKKGLLDQAVTEYEKALEINPGYEKARRNLITVSEQKREQDRLMLDYERSLAVNPEDVILHNKLGELYGRKGMVEKSIFHYRQAIALKPGYAAAYNNLAWVYATSIQEVYRNGQEAVQLATRACELTGFGNASMLDTLAAAVAEAGDFESAVLYQEKAISMSQEKDQAPLRARLRRYQSGQAYRSY
jgi:tetratricopeptide (TPR) repeat protein